MQLENGDVLEESLDIMLFALSCNSDCETRLLPEALKADILSLIKMNDGDFKWALNRYKYADRYEHSQEYYREKMKSFKPIHRINSMAE